LEAATAVFAAGGGLRNVGPAGFFFTAAVPGRAAGASSTDSMAAATSGFAATTFDFAFSRSGRTVYYTAGFKSRMLSKNAAAPT